MAVDKIAEREERLRGVQDKLTHGVEQLVTGEDWKRAIEFAARFRSRSFGNTLLIAVQAAEAYELGRVPSPHPTYVAGYRQWQQLGRQVRAGSVGYQILAPVTARFASSNPPDPAAWRRLGRGQQPRPGEVTRTRMVGVRPATVFDAAMTDGDAPIPEPPKPVLLQGQAPPGLHEALVAQIETLGFAVVDVPDAAAIGGANGLTDFTARVVSIRADMDPAARVKTAAHELGHCALGHGPSDDTQLEPGEGVVQHRGIAEVEAESFALAISAAHGLATGDYTIPYVATWASSVPGKTPVEVVQSTAEKVCKAANHVLARLDSTQVGNGTPDGLTGLGPAAETVPARAMADTTDPPGPADTPVADRAVAIRASEQPAPVAPAEPAELMDPWATSVGDRFLRDERIWQAVRITPAGAAGTSHGDGPVIHAKIVREDGTLSDYTADIWSKSISNPASAYTRLTPSPGAGASHGAAEADPDVAPNRGEAWAVTAQSQGRLSRLQRSDPTQPPATFPRVGPGR